MLSHLVIPLVIVQTVFLDTEMTKKVRIFSEPSTQTCIYLSFKVTKAVMWRWRIPHSIYVEYVKHSLASVDPRRKMHVM